MKPPITEEEVFLLLQKVDLNPQELYQLSTYALFLLLIGKVLQKEESGNNENSESDKVVRAELDPYRTSGAKTVLKLANTCNNIAMGETVNHETRSEAINVLRYINQHIT